jgi:hypothetical protein
MYKVYYCKDTAIVRLVVNQKDNLSSADNCNVIILPLAPTPVLQAVLGREVVDIDSIHYAESGFASTEHKIKAVKKFRNNLLKESDWTQLEDVPMTLKNEWKIYRQALRDVTLQETFPDNIEWPISPEIYQLSDEELESIANAN